MRIYTDEFIGQVAALFMATANLSKTAQIMGLSEATIRSWQTGKSAIAHEVWLEAVRRVQFDHARSTVAKYNWILAQTLDKLGERVAKGDPVLDKNGNIVYVPIKAKDLAIISAVVFDKRQILLNLPTKITGDSGKLSQLADQLAQLAKRDERVINDASCITMVHDGDA